MRESSSPGRAGGGGARQLVVEAVVGPIDHDGHRSSAEPTCPCRFGRTLAYRPRDRIPVAVDGGGVAGRGPWTYGRGMWKPVVVVVAG